MKYLLPLLLLLIALPTYATDTVPIDRDGVTTSLVLGDAAAKNTGTTTGTVAAGDDARFAKINGVTVDPSALTTGDFLRYNGSQYSHVPLSTGDIPDLSATYSPKVGSSSLTTTGTVTSGTWSGGFGAVSGANLTGLTAGNLSGTIPSGVLGNSTLYLGTTGITLNRGSGALTLAGITLTNPTVNGATYGQNTASASSITLDTNAYAGATLTASGATTVTITNVVAGKYFDFKVSSSGGGAITIATLTPTWVTGTPASITAGKASWFVCKGTGTNTADCAAIKENF